MSDNEKVIKQIHENYQNVNKLMVSELNLASTHGGLSGNFREEMWMKFFRNIVPKKFSLAQGVIIIDSNGNMSNEVDIAIYDEQYTPYVLQYGSLKFIPIEAVACVVECKSQSLPKDDLVKWCDKINNLKTNPTGMARMAAGHAINITTLTQKKTKPIKISVSLYSTKHENCANDEELGEYFDFLIRLKENTGKEEFFVHMNEKKLNRTLGEWSQDLNGLKSNQMEFIHLKEEEINEYKLNYSDNSFKGTLKDLEITENPILSLTFQLNQLLMLINNPMMFPHFAYAKTFNDIIKKK